MWRTSRKLNTAFSEQNKIVISLLVLAGCWLFSLLLLMILVANNHALAHRGKVYVQLNDGNTVPVQEYNFDHRSDAVIRNTVREWLQLTLEWDNRLPETQATDQGIEISRGQKVTSAAYLASYLMEDGFRRSFLKRLSQIIPAAVWRGELSSTIRIYHISKPRHKSLGLWQVDVVCTRIDLAANGEKQEVPFNRTFTLKSIEPAVSLLGEGEPNAFRSEVYRLLNNGLIISQIVVFKPT